MLTLPYREVWALDFEFVSESGARPVPVCMVAKELITGRLIRVWQDEFETTPPFDIDDDVLFVAYFASAEIGCFLELGWPVPTRVLDLYCEFRNETNGLTLSSGRGLLGALSHHGIPSITSAQKDEERALIMGGGPWTDQERVRILDYCQTDVDVLAPLLERMLPKITATPQGLGQALLRGRYMAAVARIEQAGIPIDTDTLGRMRSNWSAIKEDLVAEIDVDFSVYEGTSFRTGLFAKYLADRGIDWPRSMNGKLLLDRDTFKDMSKRHPELEPLKELRHALSELRLESLAVGPDGRNRTLISPFGASSGRNTPRAGKFIFGPSVWIRGLIKPAEGRALAYIDYKSQEVFIAAALSGDQALLQAVESGDPYLTFAKMAGLVPPEATKESHEHVRDMCKACVLGANYGMQGQSLASRTGLSVLEANDLLRRMDETFPTYTAWADRVVDTGQLAGSLNTVFGWTLNTEQAKPNTVRNYLMQGNGAEMLRLACSLVTERGITVCAPVHDALLVEAAVDEIDDVVLRTQAAMSEASRIVLGGLEVGTDVKVIRWPDRYADKRGRVMWKRVNELIDRRGSDRSGGSDTSDTSDRSGGSGG